MYHAAAGVDGLAPAASYMSLEELKQMEVMPMLCHAAPAVPAVCRHTPALRACLPAALCKLGLHVCPAHVNATLAGSSLPVCFA
jgi:hypothetical protein